MADSPLNMVESTERLLGPSADSAGHPPRQPVLRNAIFLTIGQVVGVPLSMLANAVTARYLGPAAFGYMYIGSTFNSFGFMVVEWGQGGVLPALVAADRSRTGLLVGTSIVWRSVASLAIYPVLLLLSHLLGYGDDVRVVITLLFVGYAFSAISNVGQFAMMGLERVEVAAYRQILEQLAVLAIVVPILMLGGGLNAALVGHAVVTVLVLAYISYALRTAKVGRLSVRLATLKSLLSRGTPFVFMGFAMTLQPVIDATFIARLSSVEVVGWHSAARRLVGFLIFPASALIGALYPTLCRLHGTDLDGFRRTTSNALRATSLIVIPVALGCYLYPDIGIAFFDRKLFQRAEENVRVLSLFVFLLYFTMPLGISIIAAGRQRVWTAVQSSCVLVSLALDPILVPWFQRRVGNGGLGVSVTMVISEIIVLVSGIYLAPAGIFDRPFLRSLVPTLVSGAAMVLAGRALHGLSSFVAAPVAVAAYVGCLWLTGGLEERFLAELRTMVSSKLSRLLRR